MLLCGVMLWSSALTLTAQTTPRNAAGLIAAANRLSDQSEYDKAIAAFQAALKLAQDAQDLDNQAASLYGIAGAEELRAIIPSLVLLWTPAWSCASNSENRAI